MLVVVGDSHAIALREGLDELRAKGADLGRHEPIVAGQLDHGYTFLVEKFYRARGDAIELASKRAHDSFTKLVSPTEPHILRDDPRRFVFCFGFHPSGSMLPKHWTTHTPSEAHISSKQYVSRAALAAFVRHYTRHVLAFFELLQQYGVDFSVASCSRLPPAFLSAFRTDTVAEQEILTYHDRFREAFAAELDARGIRYHLPPPETYDERGMMLQHLASDRKADDYHANARYGAIMMREILRATDAQYPLTAPQVRE